MGHRDHLLKTAGGPFFNSRRTERIKGWLKVNLSLSLSLSLLVR